MKAAGIHQIHAAAAVVRDFKNCSIKYGNAELGAASQSAAIAIKITYPRSYGSYRARRP
jgi:hypothetical protein